MVSLGLFGTISALFGPIKYGILPDQLKTRELAAGNALIESGTFAAILIGTIAGGLAAGEDKPPTIVAAIVMAIAVACWLSARMIPATGAAAPDLVVTRNPWTSTLALIRDLKSQKRLWDGTLIVSWFWLVGAVTLSVLPTLVSNVIGGAETRLHALPGPVRRRRRGRLRPGRARQPFQAQSRGRADRRLHYGGVHARARLERCTG